MLVEAAQDTRAVDVLHITLVRLVNLGMRHTALLGMPRIARLGMRQPVLRIAITQSVIQVAICTTTAAAERATAMRTLTFQAQTATLISPTPTPATL
jgi:hypothetical protein